MKRSDWLALSATAFAGWWGSPLTVDQENVWFRELEGYDEEDVLRALRALLRDSPRFAPRLGEVLTRLEPRVLSFEEAWSAIGPVLSRATVLTEAEAVIQVAALAGPVVAGWVAGYGARRLALEPTLEPTFGGAVLKRLAESYNEQIEGVAGRQLALERAQRVMGRVLERARRELPVGVEIAEEVE